MAVNSGMDYTKVQSLIEFLDGKSSEITNLIEDMVSTIPGEIEAAYSGRAAEKYKSTLTSTSEKMSETMAELIDNLKVATSDKREEYNRQDIKLEESSDV